MSGDLKPLPACPSTEVYISIMLKKTSRQVKFVDYEF